MSGRKANLELMRVAAMAMIVLFHCAYKSGFPEGPWPGFNGLFAKCCWMLGELGVNLFMLLSGYFAVNARFRPRKLIGLLAEIQFYNWLSILISCGLGMRSFPAGRELLPAFFPVVGQRWWFATAYVLVYVFSPWLGILVRVMDERQHRRLLAAALVPFCAVPTAFGFLSGSTEGLLYYNRFVWLVVVYLLGAYMARDEVRACHGKRHDAVLAAGSGLLMVLSIVLIGRFQGFFAALGTAEPAYFWQPNTVPMAALSVGVFGLFSRMEARDSRALRAAASASFGTYLLHDGELAPLIWRGIFRCAEYRDSPMLAPRMLLAAAVVLAICVCIDLVRQALARPFAGALGRLEGRRTDDP